MTTARRHVITFGAQFSAPPRGGAVDGPSAAAYDADPPGAPVFAGKAPFYRSNNAAIGIDVDIKNHNALQSTFGFDA